MGRVDDLSTAEKIGDASDTQNLEYAAPQVPKTDSPVSEDPNAIVEEEPELHARTYLAVMALFFLNFVQVYALTGPPAIVSRRARLVLQSTLEAEHAFRSNQLAYIGTNLNGTVEQNWVPNALSMVQAIVGPLIVS